MDERDLYADVQRINQENMDFRRRLETLESNDKRHEEDIRSLFVSVKGIDVMQTQIMTRFDTMEKRMFEYMSQIQNTLSEAQRSATKDRNDERKDRNIWLKQILGFAKYIVTATIGAAIAYWFNGGK